LKQWISKLINQFEFEWSDKKEGRSKDSNSEPEINEEQATLLFIIDVFNKHLIELDAHPVRKVRALLDEFAKGLMNEDQKGRERLLFRIRQFFSGYRIDEYTYVQKTFDEFRSILWDFLDQLSEELADERSEDEEILENLEQVREAVEANSIEEIKSQSRHFIDSYTEFQFNREKRRSARVKTIHENLELVKKQLVDAHENMRVDHLTKAYNRKSFDEQAKRHWKLFQISESPVSMIVLDIDHFKKVNDTYGHDMGDYVLVELVKMLKELFPRDNDFVARLGGEEFAIILPDHKTEHAIIKAERALERIRKEVLVHKDLQIKFTISMGVAELMKGEDTAHWFKRADKALYMSKNSGRNKLTVADEKFTDAA
jgi:diguanylate cyclase (GGDEF)-like protein